jgi:hypothetical protein
MLLCLKFRFRLVVLLVRMWLVKAEFRLILPVAVLRKRLAAPLLVFILGIFKSPAETDNHT